MYVTSVMMVVLLLLRLLLLLMDDNYGDDVHVHWIVVYDIHGTIVLIQMSFKIARRFWTILSFVISDYNG